MLSRIKVVSMSKTIKPGRIGFIRVTRLGCDYDDDKKRNIQTRKLKQLRRWKKRGALIVDFWFAVNRIVLPANRSKVLLKSSTQTDAGEYRGTRRSSQSFCEAYPGLIIDFLNWSVYKTAPEFEKTVARMLLALYIGNTHDEICIIYTCVRTPRSNILFSSFFR